MVSRRLAAADEEAAQAALLEDGLTDGLPVIIPTPARVRAMVEAGGRDPEESLGVVVPMNGNATVEKVAIAAVMAGCEPAYFPVVLAAVRAILRPEFTLLPMQATTGPMAPMLIVNGPVRRALGIACGVGCMGPGWHANATIGRTIRLVLINIGGGRPGTGDMASMGSPIKFSFCFGENEEESPWPPYHTTRGFEATDSVVTVIGAEGTSTTPFLAEGEGGRQPTPDAFVSSIAARLAGPGTAAFYLGRLPGWAGTYASVVLTPQAANVLARRGWTRESLQEALWERSRMAIRDRKTYACAALPGELEAWEIDPDWDDPSAFYVAFDQPSDIQVVVAGDLHANTIVPTFAYKLGAPCSELIVPDPAVTTSL